MFYITGHGPIAPSSLKHQRGDPERDEYKAQSLHGGDAELREER